MCNWSGITERDVRDQWFRWAAPLRQVWGSSNDMKRGTHRLSCQDSPWLRERVGSFSERLAHRKFALVIHLLPWQPLNCRGVNLFIFTIILLFILNIFERMINFQGGTRKAILLTKGTINYKIPQTRNTCLLITESRVSSHLAWGKFSIPAGIFC